MIIYLGVDPITGKKRQRWYTVKGNKRDAEKELTRILRELDTGQHVEPSKMSLAAYLEKWLQDCAYPTVAAKTYERYVEIVRKSIIPALGGIRLDQVKPLDIQHFYSEQLASGRKDGSGGLAPRTVLHYHRILREALQQAVKWQLIARNPCDSVEPPRPRHTEMRVFTEKQVLALLEFCRGHKYYLPILLAVTTGLRRGEILALKWSDLDLDNRTLAVMRSLQETHEGVNIKDTKTAKARRLVVLPDMVTDALAEHKEAQDKLKAMMGEAYQDHDLICSQSDGNPIIPMNLTQGFGFLLEKAGLPHIRFHDLRHTHATILLSQNVHPKVVSGRLGHSTVGITLDTYSHVLPSMQEEAAQKFNDALKAVSEEKRLAS
ncbi:MAG: tyrosine-type recombinase/integrase [Armatimonadota bacterium]